MQLEYLGYRVLAAYTILALTPRGRSAGAVVDTPYRRHSRSHGDSTSTHPDGHIHLSVSPKMITMGPGDFISIRCRARSGVHLDDIPFINFYRRLDQQTIMPLSSSTYGAMIEVVAADYTNEKRHSQKSVKVLHLLPETYQILDKGDNLFYCRGASPRGRSSTQYFIVRKV